MSPLVALSLAMSGALGIHLEEVVDVPIATALAIAQAVADGAQKRLGEKPRVDDPTWALCTSADRCLTETRARLEADAIIMVQVYGGPLNTRVIAELVKSETSTSAVLDLPKDQESWSPLVDRALATLFPRAVARTDLAISPVPAEAAPVRIAPWALAGASVVALGIGIGFGRSASSAASELDARVLPGAESDALNDRLSSHRLLSNLLIGAAVLSAAGAVVTFVLD